MIDITPSIQIDERELSERFVRASGPGGQNVNKVSTAVQLRFDARNSPSLPYAVKERLEQIAGSQMTQDGVIQIMANRHRTQERNREDAVERLVALLRRAAEPPPPRYATRTPNASRRERLDVKKRRAAIKDLRKRAGVED